MPRRNRPDKREISPDVRYSSTDVQSFINRVMRGGKRSLAARLVYDAFALIEERTGQDGLEVFEQAIQNVSPVMEVKPRRVGGATYQVPMEVAPHRRFALATRWILAAARSRSGRNFSEKLSAELLDASKGTGSSVRRRDEVHRMAESNRAFSHFRV